MQVEVAPLRRPEEAQPKTSSTPGNGALSRKSHDGNARRPWRALLVLSLGLVVTGCLWFLIRRHEQRDIHWATRIAALALRADIIADLDFEITGLVRLSMLPDRIGSAEEFWKENAGLYMQRRPGCVAVELITPDYLRKSIVYAGGAQEDTPLAFGGTPLDLLKRVAETGKPAISESVAVDGANWQRVTVAPIEAGGEPRGFVLAFFDIAKSFDAILADVKHLGFSMTILERGQERYKLVRSGAEKEAEPRSAQRAEITYPETVWELRVWPQAATLYAMDAKLPQYTLIVGVLISMLLALTAHWFYRATAQSRTLHELNAELIGEMRHREAAEEELRRAHDQLESRVERRTAELSAANAKLEHEIVEHARAEESLQQLTGQLFQLQDEERRRLARELHDGATQNLTALAMNMASMRTRALSPEQRAELLDDSVRLVQESVGDLRTTSHLLHPPLIDELGLPVPLRSYVDGFSARSGVRVAVVLDPQLGRLDRGVELGIFRVVQESLANVHRHSHSNTAKILLCREPGQIRLEISDEGTGIPPDVLSTAERGLAGVGIAGMRERVRLLGGRFEVRSSNVGTTIRILLPLADAKLGH